MGIWDAFGSSWDQLGRGTARHDGTDHVALAERIADAAARTDHGIKSVVEAIAVPVARIAPIIIRITYSTKPPIKCAEHTPMTVATHVAERNV